MVIFLYRICVLLPQLLWTESFTADRLRPAESSEDDGGWFQNQVALLVKEHLTAANFTAVSY